ncbi:MAG TPA: UDP-N-acetylmuramoyl-L-alanyl-D-glutamate--2,6-diaminopimelate ligase [Paludibacteraceae bacterium]|nr:UDP-N-acetylmuramoyl-L-alanyl-D-glutamate--2,6-diaminopimelate ligase [Paludibacteraceae bacterium]HPH62362.1 UDP-N-acetylmuramoyl-L-alanyl-D-glutamate--2,6-diaminopimelate ligase [Paludibacteraceae bacterium]
MAKKLKDILSTLDVQKCIGNDEVQVTGVQTDSRKVESGNLFVATVGTKVDGHDFIPSVIEKGAAVIVCEKLPDTLSNNVVYVKVADSNEALGRLASAWYDYPSSSLNLVGVTGTNGKTTIASLLYQIFTRFGYRCGLLSTVCNYVVDKAIPSTHTTPDPLSLNKLLAEMVSDGCQYAFMEVSSHSIDQRRIAGLDFVGGIFTNITRDHLDYHKTFANYLAVKKRFFDDLPENAFAITNLDDKNGMVMLQNTKASKHTYSTRSMADFKGKVLEDNFDGMLMEMNGYEIVVPFIGRFNASNLLAVFGAAVLLGKSEEEVLVQLSALHAVSGRFEVVKSNVSYCAIVDYAHTPDALNNVIKTINEIRCGAGRLITVVGCGGDRDKGKRPMMAKEAVCGSEQVIITSDNPRSEDPQSIIDDMLAGLDVTEKRKVLVVADRYQAVKTACALAQPDDVILVAGKGHENYQEVNGVKHHFDDKEVLHEVMDN